MKKTFLILIICALAELGFGQGYSYIKVDTSTIETNLINEIADRIAADANLQGQVTTNGVLIATNSANLLITSNAFVSADAVLQGQVTTNAADFQSLETNVYTISEADALLDGKVSTNSPAYTNVLAVAAAAATALGDNLDASFADTAGLATEDALDEKADLNGTNTAFTVANWIAVSNTTTYAAALVWDATNKVFIVTETAE